MKTSSFEKLFAGLFTLGTVVFLGSFMQDLAPAEVVAPPTLASDVPVKLSPAMKDILKLFDAKVSPGVVKAYIANYPYAYNANADQIIFLKERGVPSDVIEAMVQHRPQMAAAPPQASRPGANGQGQPAPAYSQAPAPTIAPTYTYSPAYDTYTPPSTVHVIPYTSAYNYYWGYGYAYPWYASYSYWPYYNWGCRPYYGRYGGYYGGRGWYHHYPRYGHGYWGQGYGRGAGYGPYTGHRPGGYYNPGGYGHHIPSRTYVATPRSSPRTASPVFTGASRPTFSAWSFAPRASSLGGGVRPATSGFSGGSRFGGGMAAGGFRGGGMGAGGGMRGGRR
jgi:hypothetical protein